jgi:probable HAF family extracellular repeat protein
VSRAHRPIWGSTDHPNIVRALGGLPGYPTSEAEGIDGAGQVVGYSFDRFAVYATEWSGGSVINLGGPAGSIVSTATGINDAGQTVGFSDYSAGGGALFATVWSGGSAIDLGTFPGSNVNLGLGINDAGQVVGFSNASSVPEPSTWAMMLVGFAGWGLAGYRRAKAASAS